MSKVFVLDAKKRPLAPTHPARARQLLCKGKAVVYRRYPFSIILKREVEETHAEGGLCARTACQRRLVRTKFGANTAFSTGHREIDSQPFRLKIDSGSKTTGMAILNDRTGEVVWAAELQHRGEQVKAALEKRRSVRRSRRNRKTRDPSQAQDKPRFNNRRRPKGWLPPSLMSRVYNIETWVLRLRKYCPITAISIELASFDTQKMQNPEISGVEYQQGELFGYEVSEAIQARSWFPNRRYSQSYCARRKESR